MRVGILTHYYRSQNYGGNLQAWALCRAIEDMGYDVKQVQYDRKHDLPLWSTEKGNKLVKIKNFARPMIRFAKRLVFETGSNRRAIALRRDAFLKFNREIIPHSEKVYTSKNLEKLCDEFDVFITGSDQVWHPLAVCKAYLLDFANGKGVPKFSYAASIATDELTDEQRLKYQTCLQDYQGISVRETKARELLQEGTDLQVITTLDPTLLLEKEKWDEIREPTQLKEKYLFCYFLGSDEKQRRLVSAYADKHHLKIVTLPFVGDSSGVKGQAFGDYRLCDVSPGRWVSLVKNAEYVFTDSFHATVFSLIFQKQFAVFPRSGFSKMSVRITSLLELFDAQYRFCTGSDGIELGIIENLPQLNYNRCFEKFEDKKRESVNYLQEQLCLAETRIGEASKGVHSNK